MDTLYCPVCGEQITHPEDLWTVQGREYCSEMCAKRARIKSYEQLAEEVRQTNIELRAGLNDA